MTTVSLQYFHHPLLSTPTTVHCYVKQRLLGKATRAQQPAANPDSSENSLDFPLFHFVPIRSKAWVALKLI